MDGLGDLTSHAHLLEALEQIGREICHNKTLTTTDTAGDREMESLDVGANLHERQRVGKMEDEKRG